METLGSYLKSKRESLNITLEEMSQVTRIRRTILEAIESNRHDLMPPKAFAQGFIKSYASYLGLDESDVVKRYCDVVEAQEKNEIKPEQGEGVSPARYVLTTLLVLGGGLLLVAGLLFWMVPRDVKDAEVVQPPQQDLFTSSVVITTPPPHESGEGDVERTQGLPEEAADSTSSVVPGANPRDESAAREGRAGNGIDLVTAGSTPTAGDKENNEAAVTIEQPGSPPASEPLALRIVASQDSWMKIQSDGNDPGEVYLRSGETHTAKAQERFVIRIGNAGGVELFLNEQALGKPGKPGEVIELTLPE